MDYMYGIIFIDFIKNLPKVRTKGKKASITPILLILILCPELFMCIM